MASSIRESLYLAAELLVDFQNNSHELFMLALVLKSKPRLKPRRYTDGTSRVLPFPIPLYPRGGRTSLELSLLNYNLLLMTFQAKLLFVFADSAVEHDWI